MLRVAYEVTCGLIQHVMKLGLFFMFMDWIAKPMTCTRVVMQTQSGHPSTVLLKVVYQLGWGYVILCAYPDGYLINIGTCTTFISTLKGFVVVI